MADEVKRVRVELDVVAVGADKAKTEIDNAAQNRTVNVGSGVASGGAAVGGGGGGSVRSAGSAISAERAAFRVANGSDPSQMGAERDQDFLRLDNQTARQQLAWGRNQDRYGRVGGSPPPLRAIPQSVDPLSSQVSAIMANIQRQALSQSPIVGPMYGPGTPQGAGAAAAYAANQAANVEPMYGPGNAQGALIAGIQNWAANSPGLTPQRAPLNGPSANVPGQNAGGTWATWGGVGAGRAFGIPIRLGVVAAAYAAYRSVDNAVQRYDQYQKADQLGAIGYGGEATKAMYENALSVNTNYTSKLAAYAQHITLGHISDAYADPNARLQQTQQAMIATHSAGVGMTRNANIASMRQSMGTSAYAAQNAWIQDPIQAARFGQDLAGRQAGDANDAEVRAMWAKLTPDLNPVERGNLMNDIGAKQAQQSTEMDQARAAKEPEIAGARKQQWFGVQQARSQAWGMVGSAQGNPQLALWAQLDEKYRPIFNAASGSDPASRAMLAQQTANYQGEWALGTRAINASVAQSAASVWGNAAAISGDFGTQRRAAWADFGAATQGMVQGSPDYQREFNTRMQQDQNISAREREAWAYAAGSGAVAAAQAAGQNFTQAHMSAYQRFNVATANAAPGTAGYIAASNEYYGTVETLKREQYGWNASQEAQITSANFRANFKPTQGAIADIANSAVQEMIKANDPGQRDILVKKGKAQLSAFANQWLAGSTAGNFAEGMWFQAGTGGLETGYEGPNEIGRALKTSSQKLEAAVTHPQVINYADFGN